MRDHGPTPPDIVGFGALNVDYIASASKLSARLTEPVAEWTARFEWNVETPASKDVIFRVIDQIGPSSLAGSLGGSAWNVIFGLAHMQIGLRLGYVGVVGRAEYPGLSFLTQMLPCQSYGWAVRSTRSNISPMVTARRNLGNGFSADAVWL